MELTEQDIIDRLDPPKQTVAQFHWVAELAPESGLLHGIVIGENDPTPGDDVLRKLEERTKVYVDVVYVTVKNRGSRDSISQRATDEHKAQYPEAWKAFQDWMRVRLTHTPLAVAPWGTPGVLATLRELGMVWVEELAAFAGALPAGYDEHRAWCKRFVNFKAGVKPRLRLIDGQLTEVA